MITKREKQLAIELLKEKVERLSGKKVVFKESDDSNPEVLQKEIESLYLKVFKILDKMKNNFKKEADYYKNIPKGKLEYEGLDDAKVNVLEVIEELENFGGNK